MVPSPVFEIAHLNYRDVLCGQSRWWVGAGTLSSDFKFGLSLLFILYFVLTGQRIKN